MALAPRLIVWQVTETAGFESVWLDRERLKLQAIGRAVAQLPEPYWLSYTLRTDDDAATTHLDVTAVTSRGENRLELRRDEQGWAVDGEPRPDLADALDCDVAYSPLTNTMPIVRHGMQRNPVEEKFVMAFVEVPSLRVSAMRQAYSHVGASEDGATVRYSSGTFSADLLVDEDGLVIEYPTLAVRLRPRASTAC